MQNKMYDKIVQLVWDLTIPADAPPQLLDLHTMEQVVRSYTRDVKVGPTAPYWSTVGCAAQLHTCAFTKIMLNT